MMRSLILMSFAALAACAENGAVQMPSSRMSAEDRFVMAVENNGCILNQANTARVLEQAMVSPEEVTDIVTKLASAGKIEKSMGASLRLKSGQCS